MPACARQDDRPPDVKVLPGFPFSIVRSPRSGSQRGDTKPHPAKWLFSVSATSPHCGPDHGDPPHKDFATPLWPGSRRSTSQGFCHPTVARITSIHLTRVLPPHCGPDHGDPPHNGFATPSWPQITSIHLTTVLPPHPGPRSRRSTSQGFCHPVLAPDHVDPPHKGFATPSWPKP